MNALNAHARRPPGLLEYQNVTRVSGPLIVVYGALRMNLIVLLPASTNTVLSCIVLLLTAPAVGRPARDETSVAALRDQPQVD